MLRRGLPGVSASQASSRGGKEDPSGVPVTATRPAGPFSRQGSQVQGNGEDTEDTMKNLRKTFAGIFGDM